MVDATLRYDRTAARWEYLTGDFSAWATEQEVTPLLRIGRDTDGQVVGFTFDFDRDDASFAESVEVIRREFGDDLWRQVATEPSADLDIVLPVAGSVVTRKTDDMEILRPSQRLQRAAGDVVVTDDGEAGIVTVTMTVPWWARFTKPWVAVRRRGKRDILLTGPLRVRGRTAKATLRYGMPYSGSTLTADVVKGPRGKTWVPIVAAMFAATLLVFGLVQDGTVQNSAGGSASPTSVSLTSAPPTSVASVVTGTSVPSPSTTLPVSLTSALTTSTSSSTMAPATTRAPSVIEVQPSRECNGSFCVLGVSFERVSSCMQAGDTFVQRGDGFWPEYGLPYVYFIPGIVQPPLPGGPVLRMPVTVVSRTELRGVIPQASEFPVPPVAGQMVSIVVVNGEYGVSPWGSTWSKWCG